MNKIITAIAITLFVPALGYCGASSFGEIVGAEPSVRANGMGNAYTAANDDAFGLYYNPASYTLNRKLGVVFQRGYAKDNTGAASIALPHSVAGFNVGFSLLYYNAGQIDLYSSDGYSTTVTAERDYLGILNVSKKFGMLSVGANAKVIKTNLFEQVNGSAVLGDIGALLETDIVNVGAAVQNFGDSMVIGSEAESFPVTDRIGVYKHVEKGQLGGNLAFDSVKVQDQPWYFRVGGELVYNRLVALRAGYEINNRLNDANTAQYGFGVMLKAFTIDYAYVPYHDLGNTHKFSLAWNF